MADETGRDEDWTGEPDWPADDADWTIDTVVAFGRWVQTQTTITPTIMQRWGCALRVLGEHVREHDRRLEEHDRTRDEHARQLDEYGAMVEQQAATISSLLAENELLRAKLYLQARQDD